MTRHTSKITTLAVMAMIAAAATTGCKSVCKANKKAGLATIVCQPMNQTVNPKDIASIEVKACGRDLEYQWFFDDGTRRIALDDYKGVNGAQESKLFISHVTNHVGRYSCRIISYDAEKNPVITETRQATLGYKVSKLTQSVGTVDHQPQPPGSPGNSSCGAYKSFVLFDNANHAGYQPMANQTTGIVSVNYGSSVTPLQTTSYDLLWKSGVLEKGCATNGSDTTKTFPCSSAKYYKFIVYFKSWPPPPGSGDVVLNLNF